MKGIAVSLLLLSLLSSQTLGQNNKGKRVHSEASERSLLNDADLAASQRRDFAISLVISLAREATSFSDLALRARVLARGAAIVWDVDKVNARALFVRAWEAAEKGDAEEVTIKTKDNPPPMVLALRRLGGHDLRSEVLGLMASRDRTLAEEFFTKLKKETEREPENSKSTQPFDNWSASEADTKRLEIARQLLNEGLVSQALEIALPALSFVNSKSINFLSELRKKNAEAADQMFSTLLSRTSLDPSADANTVSGLSSYAFTPGIYITFRAEGGAMWTPSEQAITPPNLPASLRDKFFQVAGNILLRRLPPPDQDSSSSGRAGTINVITRLLPLFEQYAPDTALALRAYQTELASSSFRDTGRNDNPLLSQGIRNDGPVEVLKGLQDRIDHAKTSRERDQIYATAAATLATQGDVRAREVADKIDDSERKSLVNQFIDFQFVQLAIKRKEVSEAIRLAETGQLTHTQRAFAFMQAARILMDSQREQGLELLEKATDHTLRIEKGAVDRPVLMVGIAMQLTTTDRTRGWEIMSLAAQAANASEDFNGENWIRFSMPTRNGLKTIGIGGEDFSLFHCFELLAKDDLYRSIDLTKSFKNDAAHATAILAIANATLSNRRN